MSSEKPVDPRLEQAKASDESIQKMHSILLREKPEPKEGYTPMPLFLLGFISAMIFVCSLYVVHNRGGFDPMVYDPKFDPSMAAGTAKVVEKDPIAEGKKLFTTCSTCHQATGLGLPGVYPPLAGSEWVNGSEERVVRILLHGLSGPLTVEGKEFNGNMPAFGPGGGYNWSDEKIAWVLTYVRQEWGNKAPAITADQVKAIRTEGAAGRDKPWSQAELEAIK